MNKEEKKKMLKAVKEAEQKRFEESLPMSRQHFSELFDYLDEQFSQRSCDDELTMTLEYLQCQGIDEEPVLAWLRDQGGYCDCEVLANVEELFE